MNGQGFKIKTEDTANEVAVKVGVNIINVKKVSDTIKKVSGSTP